VPSAVSEIVLLVGNGDLGQVGEDVLHLGICAAALGAAEVVEPCHAVHEVVDDSNDDRDTDGVTPDDDDGDNGSVAVIRQKSVAGDWVGGLASSTAQPTEDGEEGGEDIDTEDGADELPGWPGLTTTGDEDEPVLGKGDFEEEYTLDGTEVVDDTTVGEEESTTDDPGTESEENTEDDGDDPDLWKLPLDWALFEMGVVVGDGNGGKIGKEGKEDNELSADGLVDDDHGCDKVDLHMQAEGDTVLDVCLHTLENLTGDLDCRDNGGETWGEEDNIGSGLSGFSSTLDGDTTVGLLERWSVVDTVTSHGSQMSTLLQHLDDLVLVLGEDLGETISLLDKIVLGGSRETTVDETFRVVNLGTESQHLASFLGNSDGITSKHLNRETENLGFSDGRGGILTRRVEHGQHAEQLPFSVTFLNGNTKGTETTTSELGSLGLVEIGIFLGASREVQDSLGGTLGASVANTILDDNSSDTLGDGVEGSEFLSLPALGEDLLGSWVTLESENGDFVDGVERLDVVGGSESGNSHHPVNIDTIGDERLPDGELIGSERAGLVGAENIDTSEGFNGSELLHDGLLLGEVSGTDSEGGGGDNWKTDGDTDNQQDKSVMEQVVRAVLGSSDFQVTEETSHPGGENPANDQDQE